MKTEKSDLLNEVISTALEADYSRYNLGAGYWKSEVYQMVASAFGIAPEDIKFHLKEDIDPLKYDICVTVVEIGGECFRLEGSYDSWNGVDFYRVDRWEQVWPETVRVETWTTTRPLNGIKSERDYNED